MSPAADMGKIALRTEGKWWVGYWQRGDDKVELARVRLNLARDDDRVKQAFMDFVMLAFASAIRTAGVGEIVAWNDPTPAPESERSGNA